MKLEDHSYFPFFRFVPALAKITSAQNRVYSRAMESIQMSGMSLIFIFLKAQHTEVF